MFVATKRYFKPNHDLFQALTEYFVCLNLTRALAMSQHKIGHCINNKHTKKTLSCSINKRKVSTYQWLAEIYKANNYSCDWIIVIVKRMSKTVCSND